MDYLLLIPTIIISMVIYEGLSILINKKFGPKPVPPPVQKPLIANLLAELDLLIDMEIVGVVEVPLLVKDIPLITDFKEVQLEVIRNVTDSLSSAFFLEANRCGLKRNYILVYITRRTHAKLLEFMKEHNFTLK